MRGGEGAGDGDRWTAKASNKLNPWALKTTVAHKAFKKRNELRFCGFKFQDCPTSHHCGEKRQRDLTEKNNKKMLSRLETFM